MANLRHTATPVPEYAILGKMSAETTTALDILHTSTGQTLHDLCQRTRRTLPTSQYLLRPSHQMSNVSLAAR